MVRTDAGAALNVEAAQILSDLVEKRLDVDALRLLVVSNNLRIRELQAQLGRVWNKGFQIGMLSGVFMMTATKTMGWW